MKRYFIAGGNGFIGSSLARRILLRNAEDEVVIYDNLSSGKKEFLDEKLRNFALGRLIEIVGDIEDQATLFSAMMGADVVIHLASNPRIELAITDPTIDFWQGTFLTQLILEGMRLNKIKTIFYASGSGMYGENPKVKFNENYAPMMPISTYGASKLAGEALICSYCNMFDMTGRSFRFANVVGKNQTHGVAYDFINRLRLDPTKLAILGDGNQTKSYIYVEDVIRAIFAVEQQCKLKYDVFNIATEDYVSVDYIANIVASEMGIKPDFYYTGGDRGWKGDVPKIMFDSSKIREFYGWKNLFTSRQAIVESVRERLEE